MKRRIIYSLVTLLCLLSLSGCGGQVLKGPADMFVNRTVGPEYEAYVAADESLTPPEKEIRLSNVATFRAAVAAAPD